MARSGVQIDAERTANVERRRLVVGNRDRGVVTGRSGVRGGSSRSSRSRRRRGSRR